MITEMVIKIDLYNNFFRTFTFSHSSVYIF
ncbi:hypothetical protein [Enterococcus phage PEF1]